MGATERVSADPLAGSDDILLTRIVAMYALWIIASLPQQLTTIMKRHEEVNIVLLSAGVLTVLQSWKCFAMPNHT